jgi:predicted nucleic acid-binding protein
VRGRLDCRGAAIAVRHGATVIHKDVDVEVIAGITTLDVESLR